MAVKQRPLPALRTEAENDLLYGVRA